MMSLTVVDIGSFGEIISGPLAYLDLIINSKLMAKIGFTSRFL
jgi:hypothetical protein